MSDPSILVFSAASTGAAEAKIQLFCFHHAGGSAPFFQSWQRILPASVELIGVQLPGRWNRFEEAPVTKMDELIPSLGESLAKSVRLPFIFFGHSLGGLVAFEICRYLRKNNLQAPTQLFVSSRRPPDAALRTGMSQLSLPDFEQALSELYGPLPSEINDNLEMKAIFLNITQKDMQLYESYKMTVEEPLAVPIVAMYGRSDPSVSKDEMAPWAAHTNANCEIEEFGGDHFFIKAHEQAVVTFLLEKIGLGIE